MPDQVGKHCSEGSIQSGPSSPISGVAAHLGRRRAGHILIAVTGDPGPATPTCFRTTGLPTAKEIYLPARWHEKLAGARSG